MAFTEKTISSEPLYDAGFFKMRKDIVEVRGGRTSVRILISHNGAVAVAALTPEGKILLVKQYRKALEKLLLELPAGKIDDDEVEAEGLVPCAPGEESFISDSLPTAKRELAEETGWQAENWRKLTTIYTCVGFTNEHVDVYSCDVTSRGSTHFDPDEDLDLVEMDLKEAAELAASGGIQDSKTVAALLIIAREKGI